MKLDEALLPQLPEHMDEEEIQTEYGLACARAGALAALDEAAKVASLISTTDRLHPDVPFEEMNDNARFLAHWAAQTCAEAIRRLRDTIMEGN